MNERRAFLKMVGLGGVVLASRLGRAAPLAAKDDFFFLQLSDTHWGFAGPPNPEAATTLPRAVSVINQSPVKPDFVVFTGDLTHTTDDPAQRRTRLREFKAHVEKLDVKALRLMPGEHDASLDAGEAYREVFGETHYAFEHKGLHFIALDNVSDPKGAVGPTQLEWFDAELKKVDKDAPLVVLTHRPLFDLYPSWDWATADGAKVLALLEPHRQVTVFYGHIHQEHHHQTGSISHHASKSLVFALPAPGSQPKRAPVPWDAKQPFKGLGWRQIHAKGATLDSEERAMPA
jgi:3',5'-cyclic AMP phosphodiesterase CpdA